MPSEWFLLATDIVRAQGASVMATATLRKKQEPAVDRDGHSHWIDYDSPKLGPSQRALCGRVVDSKTFAHEPSCPDCRSKQADVDSWTF